MSEHKDAVYFDETQPADNKTKAAYRELRLWQKGYLAALPACIAAFYAQETCTPLQDAEGYADQYVEAVNDKRGQLLA